MAMDVFTWKQCLPPVWAAGSISVSSPHIWMVLLLQQRLCLPTRPMGNPCGAVLSISHTSSGRKAPLMQQHLPEAVLGKACGWKYSLGPFQGGSAASSFLKEFLFHFTDVGRNSIPSNCCVTRKCSCYSK